jgi:hypothetical protein
MSADRGFVRCPTCEEVVDPSMALRAGRTAYLLCWNGHRFGLDGQVVAAGCAPDVSTTIALTERASSEAGAG